MRTLANIFLILFLNSALLGIAALLFGNASGPGWLTPLHDFNDRLLTFFALLVYLGFAVNRHLPKSVLVPPLLFWTWSLLGFWPLASCTATPPAPVLIAQLLLTLLVLQRNRQLNRQSWLLTQSQFAGPSISTATCFRFMLLNIPLFPLLMALLLFSAASSLIEKEAAGFICLQPEGLYMVEKVYQRGEKQIHLSGMIHLGQQSYYDDLQRSLRGQQALLLAEGVSDRSGRLKNNFSYRKIADLLGLQAQKKLLLDGRLIDRESLADPTDKLPGTIDILPADIDLQAFDQRTITLLNALGHYLLENDSLLEGLRRFNNWARQNSSPETSRVVMNDLLQKRNRNLLGYLPQALAKYDRIIIPWGALHMPGLETAIRGQGFHLQRQQRRLSIDFRQLPYRQIFAGAQAAGT